MFRYAYGNTQYQLKICHIMCQGYFSGILLKFLVNFHYILESSKQQFSTTTLQWLLSKTIMLVILQEHITSFPFTPYQYQKLKLQTGTQLNILQTSICCANTLNKVLKNLKNYSIVLVHILYYQFPFSQSHQNIGQSKEVLQR